LIISKSLARIIRAFFDSSLDLRVRLFNILALGGFLVSILVGSVSWSIDSGLLNVAATFSAALLALILLGYSQLTGRYQICYYLSISLVFFVLFPILFFSAGGYRSGMPPFFVFAVAFTILMLKGKKAVIIALAEIILYISICITAYLYPDTVQVYYAQEKDILTDIISAFTLVSLVLGGCLFFFFRLYDRQQNILNQQNEILAVSSQAKTEFISNTSHEMRTPLTVISVNVQNVLEILSELKVKDCELEELLQNSQSEIMHLARMVGGMLTLASMSESTEKEVIDLSSLLKSGAEMLRLNLRNRENRLEIDIEPGLTVFGNADLLAQVASNLLQNANSHTLKGTISISARLSGREIITKVKDTGSGISPASLPRVFERGFSEKGTGFGLYLCKTVIESFGGQIWLESTLGAGTEASFSLPVYEGQLGRGRPA
jgi:signal transduction histidine kinase